MLYLQGMPVHQSADLRVHIEDLIVKRSWRERLFTRPWRPFKRTKVQPIFGPDPNVYCLDISGRKSFVCHPETAEKLFAAIEMQGQNDDRQ